MLPGVHVVDGEVGVGAPEGQKDGGAQTIVDFHLGVGVVVAVHLHDSAGGNRVQVASAHTHVGIGAGSRPGLSLDEGSDGLRIVDRITVLVVSAGVVGRGGEGEVVHQAGLPSVDHLTHGVVGGETSKNEVLDEPVHAVEDGVDLLGAGETPLHHGGGDLGFHVYVVVVDVVKVQVLGVVGVADTVVVVVVIGHVSNLPGIQRGGRLRSGKGLVEELGVVEVLRGNGNAGNSPFLHGEGLSFGWRVGIDGEVVVGMVVRRIKSEHGGTPLAVRDKRGGAVLDEGELGVLIDGGGAIVCVEVPG